MSMRRSHVSPASILLSSQETMTPSMVFGALPRPLCRYESIILLAADTCLLTELSNVVAYPCRHSRAEDRQMTTPGQPLFLKRPHLGLVRAGRAGAEGQGGGRPDPVIAFFG